MTDKPKLQPCVQCGREVREVSTRDEHAPGCPHWHDRDEQSALKTLTRLRSYAVFLKDPPPLGSPSIGPLFDFGYHAAATSVGQTLELLLNGEDAKLLQWTEGNEPLRKALGLKL